MDTEGTEKAQSTQRFWRRRGHAKQTRQRFGELSTNPAVLSRKGLRGYTISIIIDQLVGSGTSMNSN
ncbi:MAG: hypothetical protein ACK2UT_06005 [Candidatus Promineifilaceae bacterium]